MQQVSGNMKRALDTSLQDQPMATLAMAAVVGFVIGAIWKSQPPDERRRPCLPASEDKLSGGNRPRPQICKPGVDRTPVRDRARTCLGYHISAAGAALRPCVRLPADGGRPQLDRCRRNHCRFSQTTRRLWRKRLTGTGTRHAKTSDRGRITKRCSALRIAVNHSALAHMSRPQSAHRTRLWAPVEAVGILLGTAPINDDDATARREMRPFF